MPPVCMCVCVFQPLGASDYLEIARHFDTILIRNVPRLNVALKDQARRLATLVDILYDRKVKRISALAARRGRFKGCLVSLYKRYPTACLTK